MGWAAAAAAVLSLAPAGCSFCLPGACEPGTVLVPSSDVPGGPQARGRPTGPQGLWTDSTEATVTVPRPRPGGPLPDSLLAPVHEALRLAAERQERVWSETGSYTADLARLFPATGTPAPAGLRIEAAGAGGWAGSARRGELPGRSCVLSVRRTGTAPAIFTERERRAGHVDPGTILCDGPVR